jgi:hypothetical protein
MCNGSQRARIRRYTNVTGQTVMVRIVAANKAGEARPSLKAEIVMREGNA